MWGRAEQRDRFHFCMLKRLHNIRGGAPARRFVARFAEAFPGKRDSLLPRTQACGIRAFFQQTRHFPPCFQYPAEYPQCEIEQEKETQQRETERKRKGWKPYEP